MKNIMVKGTSVLLSAFLLVGCGDGACCEDDVEQLLAEQPKSESSVDETKKILVEDPNSASVVTPNLEPKAIAHANGSFDMVKLCECETVVFDANSSYDPDGDDATLSYIWRNMNNLIVSDKSSFEYKYEHQGLYEMTLIVIDDQLETAIDRVCVMVNMDEVDIPLNAKAGGDRTVNTGEKVTVTGRAMCRTDLLKYEWKEGDQLLSTEAGFEHAFEFGAHTLELRIEDSEGNIATDSVVINSI